MTNQDVDSFIAQKRAEKQSDEIILQELLTAGWDKNLVLQKLAGGQTPTPSPSPMSSSSGVSTSQTGASGHPVQVENVQYNVQVGAVRSKVGLASRIAAIFIWVTAFIVIFFLLSLRSAWLPDTGEEISDIKEALVFIIAVLIPVLPILFFAIKRLNKALMENVANVDDVYFKKSARFNLIFSVSIACIFAINLIYNILAKTILDNQDVSRGAIFDSLTLFLIPAGLVYFFWHYQGKTKR